MFRILDCNFSARCEDVLLELTYLIHRERDCRYRCQVSGVRRDAMATKDFLDGKTQRLPHGTTV